NKKLTGNQVVAIVFDKPRAKLPRPKPAVTLDRTLAVSPARGRGVAAPPPLPQPRDWSRLTALPRSCAAGRLRKQTAPSLFRRSVGKSAACLASTFQQSNLVLSLPVTMDDRRWKAFPYTQWLE